MTEGSAQGFGPLLRQLRDDAGLTQEELAEAARLSPRSISDLERGVNATARKETARLLADALGLAGPQRAHFEAIARGRGQATSPGANAGSSPGLFINLPACEAELFDPFPRWVPARPMLQAIATPAT